MEFPQLPEIWIAAAQDALPSLARDIVEQIRAEIPEYARDPNGQVAANLGEAVRSALSAFTGGLAGGAGLTARHLDVFRRLGSLEAQAGRTHDTLQLAYRIATMQVAERVALIAGQVGAPEPLRAQVRHAVLAFIEQLAVLSRAGHEEANVAGAAEQAAMSKLVEVLVQPNELSRSKIVRRAGHVAWPVPEQVQAIEFVPESQFGPAVLRALRERVGSALVIGRIPGRCLGFAPNGIDRAALQSALPAGATAVVGPEVRLLDAPRSARIAYRAGHKHAPPLEPGVLDCADHLLELFGGDANDVMAALVHLRLQPLARLGIVKRMKAAQVLSALLEYGGLPGHAPELADVSPSTRQYRKSTVEEMFGEALRDRNRRVELILALRAVLPQWEAELAMHERRRAAKREPHVDAVSTSSPTAMSDDRGKSTTKRRPNSDESDESCAETPKSHRVLGRAEQTTQPKSLAAVTSLPAAGADA